MSSIGLSADKYESFYREFDSPLMRQVRREAYGEDIGQHSWVGSDELRKDAARLGLTANHRLLDLGSGPCGPLTFLISKFGCSGVGLELSPSAIAVGNARAAELGVQSRFAAQVADLNDALPAGLGVFNSALAIDVVLHIRDRRAFYRQIADLLQPAGRFVVTDAGVVTGAVSNEEFQLRSLHGYTEFVPAGWNEQLLEAAGFRLLEIEDRTASVVRNANGRLAAMRNHREELEALTGAASLQAQSAYLTTVSELAARRAVSRMMYLVEKQITVRESR
jgi:cyclopropane fatty-acyl-phospholipid synthase-like methyltransferase